MNEEELVHKVWIEPCGCRVAVKEDSFEYSGKLVIPDKYKTRPTTGIIIALGPDVPNGVYELGDRVGYAAFSGTLFVFKGQPAWRVLSTDEILVKISRDLVLEGTAA